MLSESVIWNVSYQMISNNSRFSWAQHSRTFAYPPFSSLSRSETMACICAFGKFGFGILLILISKFRMHFHWIYCIIFSTFLFCMLLYFKISLSHRSRKMVLVNSSRFQFHFTAFNCNVNEFICQQNCLKCNFFCSSSSSSSFDVDSVIEWEWQHVSFVYIFRLLSSSNSIPG